MEYRQISWTKNHNPEKQQEMINVLENASKQKPNTNAYLIHTACWFRVKDNGNKSKIRLMKLMSEDIDVLGLEKVITLAIKCWKSGDNKGEIDRTPLYLTDKEVEFLELVRQLRIDGFYLGEQEKQLYKNTDHTTPAALDDDQDVNPFS